MVTAKRSIFKTPVTPNTIKKNKDSNLVRNWNPRRFARDSKRGAAVLLIDYAFASWLAGNVDMRQEKQYNTSIFLIEVSVFRYSFNTYLCILKGMCQVNMILP